jgi:hypothetical protein
VRKKRVVRKSARNDRLVGEGRGELEALQLLLSMQCCWPVSGRGELEALQLLLSMQCCCCGILKCVEEERRVVSD